MKKQNLTLALFSEQPYSRCTWTQFLQGNRQVGCFKRGTELAASQWISFIFFTGSEIAEDLSYLKFGFIDFFLQNKFRTDQLQSVGLNSFSVSLSFIFANYMKKTDYIWHPEALIL